MRLRGNPRVTDSSLLADFEARREGPAMRLYFARPDVDGKGAFTLPHAWPAVPVGKTSACRR